MDDIVKQAMLKWPNVPHCYGWLGLDARGNWYMRDDRAQALGGFNSGVPGAKGSRLEHEKLIAFIQRNYACDESGMWYFQNGPQRVFVELEITPWIWRISADHHVTAHDGTTVEITQCCVDEMGWLYAQTGHGFGLVHTQDVSNASEAIEQGHWSLGTVERQHLEATFGYVISPHHFQAIKKPVE